MKHLDKILTMGAMSVALVATGCAKPVHVTHQGPSVLEIDAKTYAVIAHPVGSTMSTKDVFMKRIHDAMARKGYTPAPVEQADLLISFKTLLMPVDGDAIEKYGEGATNEDGVALPAGGGARAQDVNKVVLVTIENAKTDRVLWIGWSAGEYPTDEVVMRTTESVEKILRRIPSRGT